MKKLYSGKGFHLDFKGGSYRLSNMWHSEDPNKQPLRGQVKIVEVKLIIQWRPQEVRDDGEIVGINGSQDKRNTR